MTKPTIVCPKARREEDEISSGEKVLPSAAKIVFSVMEESQGKVLKPIKKMSEAINKEDSKDFDFLDT